MPQRRAAKKDLRKNVKRHARNLVLKHRLISGIKKFKKTVEQKDAHDSALALQEVYGLLDKAASRKIIHPKKAARKKSRLAKLANTIKK